jgi:thymidylate kinase
LGVKQEEREGNSSSHEILVADANSVLRYLLILRGPQCSGKTEISEKLKERLHEIERKKQTYLLKLDEINTDRFDYVLNESLKQKYNYVVAELDYGDSHTTDPIRTWLLRFKDKAYETLSFVLEARKEVRLDRCKNDPKRTPFDKIDEVFFNYDSETFERFQHIFQEKSGIHEIVLNTENKSCSQVTDEILRHLRIK